MEPVLDAQPCNLLECVTIEVCLKRSRNIIISFIYKAPGTSIELFSERIECMFASKSNKAVFICGDFNINLLNPNKVKSIDDFLDTMYRMSLFPKITRPSRIDNIFANDIENLTVSGLLISDITDHLPVFLLVKGRYRENSLNRPKQYRRLRSNESINLFKDDLINQKWDTIYENNNVNSAYEMFMKIFCKLYD